MFRFSAILLLAVLVVMCVQINAQTSSTTTAATTGTTPTTTAAKTTTTTASTTTSTASTTSSTAAKTTTTAAKTTTTTAATTTTNPTSTSTTSASPKTTSQKSTAMPTTTVAPNSPNNYTVRVQNTTCIMMLADTVLMITYEQNSTKKNTTASVKIPKSASASGSCGNLTQELVITFFKDWKLQYTFSRDKPDADSYYVSEVMLTYKFDSHLPDAMKPEETETVLTTPKDYLKTNKGGYYICDANSTITLNNTVKISTTNYKNQAFMTGEYPKFDGDVSECDADEDTSSVVPIAVGAALAGLVVIVLIAYLIGRKRSRKTGYESV